jgi:hypothetical protein
MEDELEDDFARRYGGSWTLASQFQPDTAPHSADEIVKDLSLDPERRTAVVFTHVLWDATLFFGVDLFANYADWLVRTVESAIQNPSINWIVKAHPANVFRGRHGDVSGGSREVSLLQDNFGQLPDHVRLLLPETRISTTSLYEFADYGLTVRGTAGIEMACFGKRVFTAGTGTYDGLGFTTDSSSAGEYLERLASIETYGPPEEEATLLARRYAHALFCLRPWTLQSFVPTFDFPEHGWHPLDRNLELRARSVGDINRYGDLTRWAAWVLDETGPDFFGRWPGQQGADASAQMRRTYSGK